MHFSKYCDPSTAPLLVNNSIVEDDEGLELDNGPTAGFLVGSRE